MGRDYLFEQWLDAQVAKANSKRKYTKRFIGERGYPHLDSKLFYPRVGNNVEQAAWLKEVVTQTDKLHSHGFLPFIKSDKRQRRFKEPPHDYIYSSARGDRDQKKFPYIKSRPIMYASHRDACIFSFYSYCLETEYEKELISRSLEDCVIAYRSIDGKNNVDFAKSAFDEMTKRDEYDCIMVDVKGFFDNLDHKLLWQQWNSVLPGGFKANTDHQIIYDRITGYRYLNGYEAVRTLKANKRNYLFSDKGCFRLCKLQDYNQLLKKSVNTNNTGRGIPQGSPISGMLANMYLLEFDVAMKSLIVDTHGGIYQRYSDDILILCPSGTAKEVYDEVQRLLAQVKLRLGPDKTEAFRKSEGDSRLKKITTEVEPKGNITRKEAQYLGFHFDGETISFRPSTLSKHVRGRRKPDYMKGAYTKTRSAKVARQLNKIRQVVKKKP
jgi:RNA-directed DNA polymerase